MAFRRQVTGVTYGKSVYPRYDAADLGFRRYWYPALFTRQLRRRPRCVTLCGERLAFFRDGGRVYTLRDRCPHRGIPLSIGVREFPGTITCRYHGWTYDLETGRLLAALTDGPDSPICRHPGEAVCVRTYPTTERAGVIWVYLGEGEPPPVEEQVPTELFEPMAAIVGRITEKQGDWRHAAENGFDEGHAKYLHRNALWKLLRYIAAWSTVEPVPTEDGRWLTRRVTSVGHRSEYPGLGHWPSRRPFWKAVEGKPGGPPGARVSIRMPGVLRVEYFGRWNHFEWYVPTEVGRFRYYQFIQKRTGGLGRLWLRIWYWIYLRWVFHVDFFNQDGWMIRLMRTPPEQLYRPDVAIVAWRRLCEETARDAGTPIAADAEAVRGG